MLGAEIKSADKPYYEHWLAALERIVEAKGLMSHGERLEPHRGLGPGRPRNPPWPAHRTQPILASQGNCSSSQ